MYWGSKDVDFHGTGSQGSDLHLVVTSAEFMGLPPDRQHWVGTEVFADIDIPLRDGMEGKLIVFHTQKERWKNPGGQRWKGREAHRIPHPERKVEEPRGAVELVLASNSDLAIGQLLTLLPGEGCSSRHDLWEVLGNMAQVPVDVNSWPW